MPAIKTNTPKSSAFVELREKTKALNETNDCSVKALAIVTGLGYEPCHAALKNAGRRDRDGATVKQMRMALLALGFIAKYDREFPSDMISTYPQAHQILKGLTTHHPVRFSKQWADVRPCLLMQTRHVSAFVDGRVHDWAEGTARRVTEVWFVEKA